MDRARGVIHTAICGKSTAEREKAGAEVRRSIKGICFILKTARVTTPLPPLLLGRERMERPDRVGSYTPSYGLLIFVTNETGSIARF